MPQWGAPSLLIAESCMELDARAPCLGRGRHPAGSALGDLPAGSGGGHPFPGLQHPGAAGRVGDRRQRLTTTHLAASRPLPPPAHEPTAPAPPTVADPHYAAAHRPSCRPPSRVASPCRRACCGCSSPGRCALLPKGRVVCLVWEVVCAPPARTPHAPVAAIGHLATSLPAPFRPCRCPTRRRSSPSLRTSGVPAGQQPVSGAAPGGNEKGWVSPSVPATTLHPIVATLVVKCH